MQPNLNPHDEIRALEAEIAHKKKLLDKSFADDEFLRKTKAIFHDLKILTVKLAEMKAGLIKNAE